MQDRVASLRPVLATGALAGLIGAAFLDAYSIATTLLIDRAEPHQNASWLGGIFHQYAALFVGKAAAISPAGEWLGVAATFIIGVAWGIGYAYAASRTPGLALRPFGAGLLFGLVVYLMLQLMELAAGTFAATDALRFYDDIVAYALFFGIPVAFVVRKRMRA